MSRYLIGLFWVSALLFSVWQPAAAQSSVKYPLKVSANGRHLEYQDGTPFLVVADAAWQMLRRLRYDDAVQYLDIRKSQAINTILVHLLPALPQQKNVHGAAVFEDQDLSKPNFAYFDHLEKIILAAQKKDLSVGVIVSRKSWNTIFETQGEAACRAYGAYVSKRLGKFDNVVWIISQEENQESFIYRSVLEGISKYSKGQLIGSFSSCSPTWMVDKQPDPDIRFIVPDSTVSVGEYGALSAWQRRIGQSYHRPFVVANLELPREVADQSSYIRNQAYRSVLSGSAGFCHSSTIKNFHATWKTNIMRDGTEYLTHLATIMSRFPWALMYPETESLLTQDSTDRADVSTFFLSNKRMAMLYMPSSRSMRLDLSTLKGEEFLAVWYSPRTGKKWPGGDLPIATIATVTPPDAQAGWDWILLIGSKR
jgi:hypothetical protein